MTRGIVVTNGTPIKGMVFHMALVFEQSYRFVREFKLMPIVTHHTATKEVYTGDTFERGKKEKLVMVEDTLIFGETLEWQDLDDRGREIEVVQKYSRSPQIYESRMFDGECQLLLQGIMSKNRQVLWMLDIWPNLDIPFELQQKSHPNVTVNAWVTLQIQSDHSLKYELHSFKDTAEHFQHLVQKAKWNEGDEGNLSFFQDMMNSNLQNSEFLPQISDSLTGMQGFVISDKIILPSDPLHRDICFHRVVFTEGDRFPPIGSFVKFNAEKMDFLNIYAVSEVVDVNRGNNLKITENGMVKITIRYNPDLPGFYFSELLQTYFDDSTNVLEAWLVSRYSKSTLQVAVSAGEPSQSGIPRFTVIGITDVKTAKIEKLRESGELRLDNEPAILIDEKGKLHVPRLPRSNFRLPSSSGDSFPPGTHFLISAKLEKRWKIEKIEVNTRVPPVMTVNAFDEKSRRKILWFRVPSARGCCQLPYLLHSPLFGFIQPPRSFRLRRRPESVTLTNVWIALNDCHPGDFLCPPAKFKFCGMGAAPEFSKKIPQPLEASNRSTSSTSDDDDISAQYAHNEFNVPTVYGAINAEEFERNLRNPRGESNLNNLICKIEASPLWKAKPIKYIESEISEHMKSCPECSEHQYSDNCGFTEFLAYALRQKPEISEIFTHDLLEMVTLRRFRK